MSFQIIAGGRTISQNSHGAECLQAEVRLNRSSAQKLRLDLKRRHGRTHEG